MKMNLFVLNKYNRIHTVMCSIVRSVKYFILYAEWQYFMWPSERKTKIKCKSLTQLKT